MNKFKSKKGFTLAELLIVVAIIAVLVAIAVPLFVGALNKAEEATVEANKRAVRGAAVVAILEAEKPTTAPTKAGVDETGKIYTGVASGSTFVWQLVGPWKVTAELNSNGDVTKLSIEATSTITESYTEKDGTITVVLKVTELKANAS